MVGANLAGIPASCMAMKPSAMHGLHGMLPMPDSQTRQNIPTSSHLELLQGESPAQARLGVVPDGLASDNGLQAASDGPREDLLRLLGTSCAHLSDIRLEPTIALLFPIPPSSPLPKTD
jgi:hypothetical protein